MTIRSSGLITGIGGAVHVNRNSPAKKQGFTIGLVLGNGPVTLDLSYIYLPFDDRVTDGTGTDHLAGTWRFTGAEYGINVHWRP